MVIVLKVISVLCIVKRLYWVNIIVFFKFFGVVVVWVFLLVLIRLLIGEESYWIFYRMLLKIIDSRIMGSNELFIDYYLS